MTNYSLFLDDIRQPPRTQSSELDQEWVVARSSNEAIQIIMERGIPNKISFDHDLGGEDTAMFLIHWIIESVLDQELNIPPDFQYTIHSANPVGKANIDGLMKSFLKSITT